MLKIRPLPPALAKKVKELNENLDQLERDVELIRDWIRQESHLIANPRDQLIVSYLRACRYSIEKVKRKYEEQIAIRTQTSDIFYNRNLLGRKSQDILSLGFLIPLPLHATESGPTILIYRPGAYDTNVYHFEEVCGPHTAVFDIMMHEDDNFAISGVVLVVDSTNIGMNFVMQVNLTFLMKLLSFVQKSSPFIINSIHLINMHKAIEPLFNLCKSLISKKTLHKIHIHGDLDSLYQYVPRKVLPKEYGGTGPTMDEVVEMFMEQIERNIDLLAELDNNYIDESKRQVPIKGRESDVIGSFRQLSFD